MLVTDALEAIVETTLRFTEAVLGEGPAGIFYTIRVASGSLLTEDTSDGWLARTLAALAASERVTLLPRTTAFGYFPHNFVGLNERLTDHLPAATADLPRERQWGRSMAPVASTTDRARTCHSRSRGASLGGLAR